jgi:hypothetical protein
LAEPEAAAPSSPAQASPSGTAAKTSKKQKKSGEGTFIKAFRRVGNVVASVAAAGYVGKGFVMPASPAPALAEPEAAAPSDLII